ncbi:MAG: glycosyl hydrolase [Actinomycetota bacterium]
MRATAVAVLAAAAAVAAAPSAGAPPSAAADHAKTRAGTPAKTPKPRARKPKPPAIPALPTSCFQFGVYRHDPVRGVPALQRTLGVGITTVSTYVTTGKALDPALVALARQKRLRLLVSWMPDDGRGTPTQPRFTLARIARGVLDADLRALAREMKDAGVPILFRPMPEPNTPWYAWSGLANGNTPAGYVAAWKRVRRIVKPLAGKRVQLLWSPYYRSVPDTEANALGLYFPGPAMVDAVGASGYNFGTVGDLAWTDPRPLFSAAYRDIQALAAKPFWISETGSTATGGDKAAWVSGLTALKAEMPNLRGVVWFDVTDPTGDFRLTGAALPAAKALFRGRCIA